MKAEIISEYEYQRRANAATNEELIDKLAWLMDRSIRIGNFHIGIDPILGLIPGFGDVLGGLVSAVIIVHAHQTGIPKATLLRMVANVGIDSALGSIPFVGDLFDFAWKANSRNLQLYRSAIRGENREARDVTFLTLLLLALVVLISIPVLLIFWLARSVSA